jgi:beta-lactam-binding protein with PASTA domain
MKTRFKNIKTKFSRLFELSYGQYQTSLKTGLLKALKDFLITYPRFFIIVLITTITPIIIALIVFFFFTATRPSTTIPQLKGLSIIDAATQLQHTKLKAILMPQNSDIYPRNYVIAQDIPAGRKVKQDREILLYINAGPNNHSFPSFVGENIYKVANTLNTLDENFKKIFINSINWVDSEKPFGQIINQSPPTANYTQAPLGLDLTVSNNSQKVIASYENHNIEEVLYKIGEMGLFFTTQEKEVSDPNMDGKVLTQEPKQGQIFQKGDYIRFTVGRYKKNSSPVKYLQFIVPSDLNQKLISIIFKDNQGEKILFQGTVTAGDILFPTSTVHGEWKLSIYTEENGARNLYKEIQE